jgi:hypothetical protein
MHVAKAALFGFKLGVFACAVGASFGFIGVPAANAITFDFSSNAGNLGVTQDYFSSGFTVTAAGFTSNAFGTHTVGLFGKAAGSDENGLGLQDDPTGNHEISGNNLIRIQLPTGLTNIMFKMGSSTGGEGWDVFGSLLPTSGYVSLLTGADESVHSLALYSYYYFIATGGGSNNVLLGDLYASPAPLPAALPLFGTVLGAGYFLSKRRKRRAVASASA